MSHLLEPATPVVRACAGLHADQAAGTLREIHEQLASTELTTHENLFVLDNAVDLENVLCEINTDYGKLVSERRTDRCRYKDDARKRLRPAGRNLSPRQSGKKPARTDRGTDRPPSWEDNIFYIEDEFGRT